MCCGLQLVEQGFQYRTFPNDFLKVVFGANLIFKIKLLFGELVLELGNFLKRQRIFDGNGYLRSNLSQEVLVLLWERRIAKAGDIEGSQGSFTRNEGNATLRAHSFGDQPAGNI